MEKMEKRNDRNRYKSDEQVIDELRSFLVGKCRVSKALLRKELRKTFGEQRERSLLCSAVKRGILTPVRFSGMVTRSYEIKEGVF